MVPPWCDATSRPAPRRWLRETDRSPPAGDGAPADEPRIDTRDEPDERILCAACGHEITDASARTSRAGRGVHTCVNPSGHVYRIACFRRAPGCVGTGAFSSYYSWFAGYLWQIACCGACSMHLGWAFEPAGATETDEPFWGLIVDRITESKPKQP